MSTPLMVICRGCNRATHIHFATEIECNTARSGRTTSIDSATGEPVKLYLCPRCEARAKEQSRKLQELFAGPSPIIDIMHYRRKKMQS